MTTFFIATATVLLLLLAGGMLLVFRFHRRDEKIMVVQLLNSMGVALLLVLAEALGDRTLYDVGLVFVVLASVSTVAFVHRAEPPPERSAPHDPA